MGKPTTRKRKVGRVNANASGAVARPREIDEILNERGENYGDYGEVATLSQQLKNTLRRSKNWDLLEHFIQESLDMVCAKFARLLTGNPHYEDNFTDSIGYLTLVLDTLLSYKSIPGEEWRGILDSNYSISNFGRVLFRGEKRKYTDKRGYNVELYIRPRLLTPSMPDARHYSTVRIVVNGIRKKVAVHQLVLTAFVGPCPKGCESRHLNGNKSDNTLLNLAYGTGSENCEDKRQHGTLLCGERHPFSKLTDKQVLEIRRAVAEGESRTKMAKKYNVGIQTVHKIVKNTRWKHLSKS